MITVRNILAQIQDAVDDPGGVNFADSAFVIPKLQLVYNDIFLKFSDYDLSFDEHVTVLPSVAANTSDLSQYQLPSQPLEVLFNPQKLEWKLPGQDDTNYIESQRTDQLPDQVNTQGVNAWEYREDIIYITPSTVACDIRIRAEMLNVPFRSQDDTITNAFVTTVVFKTAAHIGKVRGNDKWVEIYGADGDAALDALERKLVKQDQALSRRFGSFRPTRKFVGGTTK